MMDGLSTASTFDFGGGRVTVMSGGVLHLSYVLRELFCLDGVAGMLVVLIVLIVLLVALSRAAVQTTAMAELKVLEGGELRLDGGRVTCDSNQPVIDGRVRISDGVFMSSSGSLSPSGSVFVTGTTSNVQMGLNTNFGSYTQVGGVFSGVAFSCGYSGSLNVTGGSFAPTSQFTIASGCNAWFNGGGIDITNMIVGGNTHEPCLFVFCCFDCLIGRACVLDRSMSAHNDRYTYDSEIGHFNRCDVIDRYNGYYEHSESDYVELPHPIHGRYTEFIRRFNHNGRCWY